MAKHNKKDKSKKKHKNDTAAPISADNELKRLREENEELRERLERIAELARFAPPSNADLIAKETEDHQTEGVHPL